MRAALLADERHVPPVVVALVATGIGWSIAWVAATTMIQRVAGDDVMTRVFGVTESTQTGSEAIGGLLVPILVAAVGPGGALAALGIGLTIVALIAAPTLLRADRVDPALLHDVAILRSVPMFAPLAGPVLERLGSGAEHVNAVPGTPIIRGRRGRRPVLRRGRWACRRRRSRSR